MKPFNSTHSLKYLPRIKYFGPVFQKRIYLLLFSLIFAETSCRKLVTSDFPEFDAVPVINSILVADSLLTVNLSLTDKIGEEPLDWVENAQVFIQTDNGQYDTLIYTEKGIYSSVLYVQPLGSYTCHVNIPGQDQIICKSDIPVTPEIINIQHINEAGKDAEGISYPAIKIKFKNTPEEIQYFQVAIKLMVYDDVEFAQMAAITDPVLLNEGIPLPVFSNELIDTDTYTMTINYTTGSAGNSGEGWQTNLYPLVIELRAISYDYYMYIKQLYLYEKGRYPVDVGNGAVTNFNLYSNISGGYGIFAGYSSVVSDTIYPYQIEQ